MEEIFDGISLEELAGGTVSDPNASGMKQGDDEQNASKATTTPGANEKETKDDNDDPNAIDITELASSGSGEEGEKDDNINDSSQTPTDDKGTNSPSSKTTDATTSLASALADVGVFSSLTEEEIGEIKDAKSLMDAVRKQTEDNRYSDLTDDQKLYLDALKEGVPEKEFHEHASSVAQYKALKDDAITGNKALVTELIRRSLVVKGVDNSTATEMAELQASKEDADARGIAAKQSLISHEELELNKKIESNKLAREQKEKDEKEAILNLKAKIDQSGEVLPGIKVNTRTKNTIFKGMTTPVGTDEEGQPLNEVMLKYKEDPDFRYALHAMYHVTKGFTDFNKIKASAKSSAVEELEAKLQGGNNHRSGSPSSAGPGGRTAREIADSLPSNFGRK